MKKILKTIKHYFELGFLLVCNDIAAILPRNGVYIFAKLLGLFVLYIVPIRKKTAWYNIRRVFPDKSNEEIESIIRKMYINFGMVICEGMVMPRLRPFMDKTVTMHGIEHLQKAYDKGKGVILWTGHLGHWHVMGQRLIDLGFPLNNIVKRQRNPFVFERTIRLMYESGAKVTILQKTPKNIFKAFKDKDVVEFLSDQDAGPEGVFVDFFGLKAATAAGPALFSLKLDVPIVFAVDVRDDRMYHSVFIEPVEYSATGDEAQDVFELTAILTKKLEHYIKQYPDQYFWLHKRWLTRPPTAPPKA